MKNLKERSVQADLLGQAEKALWNDFVTDDKTEGHLKAGSIAYARFLTNPGAPERNIRHQRDASAIVEEFLTAIRR